MGLIRWIRTAAEMPAKRAFLRSLGFQCNDRGYWVSDHSKTRIHERDIRHMTLMELRHHYGNYLF